MLIAGRYEPAELVGSGGMADVFRARDTVLERDVALKVLRVQAEDGTERDRFAAEARTLARLNHPGLVTVLDAGIDGERPYLVMELVEGTTLSRYVGDVGPLDADRVRDVGGQLADALAHAHAQGVVHRDVKPSNVLVREDGEVVLTDFGIAQLVSHAAPLTATGQVIGSPAYLAPEQVNGQHATTAVDVYALGLVLLEAYTATRTYEGPPVEAAIARLTTPPTFPTSLPHDLLDLLQRMTAIEPTSRPTADEVTARLRGVAVPTPTMVLDLPQRRRRRPALLALGAAAAALAVALVVIPNLGSDKVAASPVPTPTPSTSTPTPTVTPVAVKARTPQTKVHPHKKPKAHAKPHAPGKAKGPGKGAAKPKGPKKP